MRLPFTFLLLLFAVACAPVGRALIPGVTTVSGIDFSSYTKQGFLITPEKYVGPYESVGIISVAVFPDARLHEAHFNDRKTLTWIAEPLEVGAVVQQAHRQAVAMGADAIINFTASRVERSYPELTVYGIEVHGYAIRRLNDAREDVSQDTGSP